MSRITGPDAEIVARHLRHIRLMGQSESSIYSRLDALRADVAAIRDRLEELARMAGIFYDSGREDALMRGPDRLDGELADVVPFPRREERRA